jgi:acyl carrier protein
MDETRERLLRCFQAVFPDLADSEIPRASATRLATWDSVATVTLAATVEEEFGIQFDPREIEHLNSFQAFLERVAGAAR